MAFSRFPAADLGQWQPGSWLDLPALVVTFGLAALVLWPLLWLAPFVLILQLIAARQVWKFLGRDAARSLPTRTDQGAHSGAAAETVPAAAAVAALPAANPLKLRRRLSIMQRIQQQSSNVNPFVNPTWRVSALERARLTLMAVTLAPLRAAGMAAIVLACAAVCQVITLGHSRREPLGGWRRLAVIWFLRPLVRALLFVMGFFYIPTTGRPASNEEAPVIVSNHITFLEPVFFISVFAPSPVGEQSNLNAPVIGPILRALGLIGVDRKSPTSRADVVHAIKERASSASWPQLLLFPEGTTTAGNSMISFKPGAFLPGAPVQPCLIRFHNERHNPCWVTAGPAMPVLMLRMLCEPVNYLSCEFLPVYRPSEAERKDAVLFARNVRAVMAARLGCPVTEHSFEDIVLQKEAMEAHQAPEVMQVELDKIKSSLHMDLAEVKNQLARFRAMDQNGDGTLDVDEFERGLGFATPSAAVRNMFSMFDTHDSGRIDFREFLIGMGILSSSDDADRDAILELAFKMFDVDGAGLVSVQVLRSAFRSMLPETSAEDEQLAFANLESQVKRGAPGVDLVAFKEFALRDPRYLSLFKQTMWQAGASSGGGAKAV